MSASCENLLRIALDELLPTPCYLSEVEEWCRQRGQSSSILKTLESVVVKIDEDKIVVSYGPHPSAEDRVASLLLPYVPMTLKDIRPLFRLHFPGVTFQQSSLMLGLELDPRVVRLTGERYGLREESEDEDSPKKETKKQAEVPKAAVPQNAVVDLGEDVLNFSDISLAALAFNPRTLRALVLQRLYSVSDVFEHLGNQSVALEDFRRAHWLDLFSTLRSLIPANHPARQRIQKSEGHQAAAAPISVVKSVSPDAGAEISDSEFRRMLEETPEGGLLRLGRCVVRVEQPIAISKSIRILGEGADASQILFKGFPADKSGILHFSGGGSWRLIGLSVGFDSGDEDMPEDYGCYAVSVDDGEIECLECRFHGSLNVGLEVNGDTVGYVSGCEFDHNMYGIWADDQCAVHFVKNRLHHHTDDGMVLAGDTQCRVAQNESFENEGCGIFVFREAHPILERNILHGNVCGLYYGDDSGGTASENECRNNKAEGIRVLNEAQPSLVSNRCEGNGSAGISFAGASEGRAVSNSCKNNQDGISVTEDATPTLRGNSYHWNRGHDVFFAKPENAKNVTSS